jgi:NADH dehydrogenase (ubiquinone) Fe-S protein 8
MATFARLNRFVASSRLVTLPAPSNAVFTRALTSSSRLAFAEPLPGSPEQHPHPRVQPSTPRSPDPSKTALQGAEALPYTDPYKGGPSALDKAAEMFFFTEILRGWSVFFRALLLRHSSLRVDSFFLPGMWITMEQVFRPPYTIM